MPRYSPMNYEFGHGCPLKPGVGRENAPYAIALTAGSVLIPLPLRWRYNSAPTRRFRQTFGASRYGL